MMTSTFDKIYANAQNMNIETSEWFNRAGFFQCKAYTHDGDIAVSDRVPVRTYDFQNLVKGYKS